MSSYYYDFHIHSCLSPCGDDDMTPANIAGMATLAGLQMVALTDHNSCKNCPAFFEAAARYGLIPIAGMELTTAEDIHLVCLFDTLEHAMAFDTEVATRRIRIPNRPDIFGNQRILDAEDNLIAEEPDLLTNATTLSLEEAEAVVRYYGGGVYPAHIDREANGIIAMLGTLPEEPAFFAAEFADSEKVCDYRARYPVPEQILIGSDAHYLTDIPDAAHRINLQGDTPEAIRHHLIRLLRGEDEA